MRLAATDSALGCAHREVRQVVDHWALSQVADVVELLALELVSMALGGSVATPHYRDLLKVRLLELRFRFDAQGLVIAIWDDDPRPPQLKRSDADQGDGGWLHFVPMLADAWDFFPSGGGKVTWCEVRIPVAGEWWLPRRVRIRSNGPQMVITTDLALLERVRDGLLLLDTDSRTKGQQP